MKKAIQEISYLYCCVAAAILLSLNVSAQTKEVNNQTQSWVSLNTTMQVYKKFGFVADVHIRRNNVVNVPGFYFLRAGVSYKFTDAFSAVLGYGQMWVAPAKSGWHHYGQEHRIYQQLQLSSKVGRIGLLNRLRNEQRWQGKMVNDQFTHRFKFTDRIRYLISVNIPIFKSTRLPSLVVADEIAVQMGKEVIYNTFDQNRSFIGIKQQVSKSLSFDMGYMLVYQQKASGYQFDRNNTFRLFFYYTKDFRKKDRL